VAEENFFGFDINPDLVKATKMNMVMNNDGSGNISRTDSLLPPHEWDDDFKTYISKKLGIKKTDLKNEKDLQLFDVIITNPPFGAKIPIEEKNILSQYDLGHIWKKYDKSLWEKSKKLQSYQPPQILFIERCLQLLKPKGRMGIVLPDGILSNTSDGYIRRFILNNSKIIAIVDCPPETFQPSTATKTSVLFLEKTEKKSEEDYKIFMSVIKECGHDKRGRENRLDELPLVIKKFKEREKINGYDRLGFFINVSDIEKSEDLILTPKYYNPEIKLKLKELEQSGKYELISLKKLVKDGVINIKRGNEIGSKHYGLGDIPFIRTSDISNWEIRINQETCVDEDVYIKYAKNQDLHINDILFVNDGGRMVGEVAIITLHDGKIIIQSHIRRIRIINKEKLNPYLLLYLFKLPIVQEQIESKRFVQATIPSLGSRLLEVILPIPKNENMKKDII